MAETNEMDWHWKRKGMDRCSGQYPFDFLSQNSYEEEDRGSNAPSRIGISNNIN